MSEYAFVQIPTGWGDETKSYIYIDLEQLSEDQRESMDQSGFVGCHRTPVMQTSITNPDQLANFAYGAPSFTVGPDVSDGNDSDQIMDVTRGEIEAIHAQLMADQPLSAPECDRTAENNAAHTPTLGNPI